MLCYAPQYICLLSEYCYFCDNSSLKLPHSRKELAPPMAGAGQSPTSTRSIQTQTDLTWTKYHEAPSAVNKGSTASCQTTQKLLHQMTRQACLAPLLGLAEVDSKQEEEDQVHLLQKITQSHHKHHGQLPPVASGRHASHSPTDKEKAKKWPQVVLCMTTMQFIHKLTAVSIYKIK